MTTTPLAVNCLPKVWTAVSAGSSTVTIVGPGAGRYKIAAGAAPPAAVDGFGLVVFDPFGWCGLAGLVAGTDNVYVSPTGDAAVTVNTINS